MPDEIEVEIPLTESELKQKQEDELCKEIYFKAEIEGIKNKELAEAYNMSPQMISYRVKKGRKITTKEINRTPEEIRTDVYNKYGFLWREALKLYKQSQDLNTLKFMDAVLTAERKIYSVDAAPKGPVNEKGESTNTQLVLVFSDDNYKKIEEQSGYNRLTAGQVIDGEVKKV